MLFSSHESMFLTPRNGFRATPIPEPLRKGSRMSRLPVFKRLSSRPLFRVFRDESEPVILTFPRKGWRAPLDGEARRGEKSGPQRIALCDFRPSEKPMDLLTRARALHENRCCPHCRRAGAIPLDLGDGDARNPAMPVPGSATLVGFYCEACGAEWPV